MPVSVRIVESTAVSSAGSQRSFFEGIDLARAAAVILVLWSHAVVLAPAEAIPILFPSLFRPGFWGISIFYAISGFLVGLQVLDCLSKGTRSSVIRFLGRRWLRTVPTYWIILAGLLLAGYFGWPGWGTMAANLLFLAFPGGLHAPLLPVSWTLVIEEWSYLALALLSLVLLAWPGCSDERRRSRLLVFVLVAWIVLSCASRYAMALSGPTIVTFKQNPFTQLDALSSGFGLALLYRQFAQRFELLSSWILHRPWWPAVAMTLLGVAGSVLFRDPSRLLPEFQAFWLSWIFYPLAGILSCGFLLSLWTFRYAQLPRLVSHALRTVSRASYSIYLLHVPLRVYVFDGHVGYGSLALYVVTSVAVGWMVWLLVEVPFIRLRHAF